MSREFITILKININLLTFIAVFAASHLYSEDLSSFRCFELEGAKIIAEDGTLVTRCETTGEFLNGFGCFVG